MADDTKLQRNLSSMFAGHSMIPATVNPNNPEMTVPVTPNNPLPVALMGADGAAATIEGPKVTATYPSRSITVTNTAVGITPPAEATHALLTVTAGTVRVSLGTDLNTAPEQPTGTTIEVSGAELASIRLLNTTGTTATVWVEYWTEATK